MKIGIVGSGYVGLSAAKMWKEKGHVVSITTRSLEKSYQLRANADTVYVIDEDWHTFLENQDVVLLCVAPTDGNYLETYLRSAEKIKVGLKGCDLKQIIYTSSTSVYGDHDNEEVVETSSLKPMNLQAEILKATEDLLLTLQTKTRNVVVFRLGEIVGPGRELENRISKMQGKEIPGSGDGFMNLSSLDLILKGLDVAVEKELNGVFNLVEDIRVTRKEYYEQICKKNNWEMPIWNSQLKSPHAGKKRVNSDKFNNLD